MPLIGETILGDSFALGPGGKGSNQAVSAARAGGDVRFVSKLGRDTFGDMAIDLWEKAGVTPHVAWDENGFTGAASIFVDSDTGNNAIIISPGSAGTIGPMDVEAEAETIGSASV